MTIQNTIAILQALQNELSAKEGVHQSEMTQLSIAIGELKAVKYAMNQAQFDAVEEMADYLADEKDHWLESEVPIENHIFGSVCVAQQFIGQQGE